MDPGTVAVIGLCVFLALWYGAGYLYNRRRGQQLFRWLEAGLDILGDEREAGWIGSPGSAARVTVAHANPPFRRLEITLLLENREIAPLWLVDRLRGRRDWLVMKATLRSPGRGEVEVVSTRRRAARDGEQPWARQEGPHGLGVAYQGGGAQRRVRALEPWLQTYGAGLDRLSWRKADPHLQLQINIAGLLARSSAEFLADLQAAVGEAVQAST